jgi:DNA replication protein DnaC
MAALTLLNPALPQAATGIRKLSDSGPILDDSKISSRPQANLDCTLCNGMGWECLPGGARRCACLRDSIKRIKLAAIPPLFAEFSLDTIKADPARHPRQVALFDAMRAEPQASYVLCGRNGSGKTLAGWMLYRAAVDRETLATGLTCADLMRQFRDWEFDSEKLPAISPADLRSNEKRFLFLDEIDKVKPTEFAANQLFEVVNEAYNYRHQLVVTSNTPLAGLVKHWSREAVTIGSAIAGRLQELEGGILADMF